MIHNLYKQRGETPLECIQRFIDVSPDLKKEKFTYLGRLDPMADGVLLVASGDDIKRKEEFLGLDKEYDFVSLFGFATDTYDILGRIVRVSRIEDFDENELRRISKIYIGERKQKYPPYSSKVFASLKKFPHEADELPEDLTKDIVIHNLQLHTVESLSAKELFGRLLMDISKVKGDFRQNETLILWRQILDSIKDNPNIIARFSAHVSSGTYIRSIVNDLGNTLGLGACALSITRTRLGEYHLKDSQKF